jgi:glycosyltransferase involved in cell wall biosynthesis
MKVLVVSNLFQPEVLGGYEIGCSQVVESLREAGQDIEVLTSTMVPQMGRDYVHTLLDCSIWANLRNMPRLAKLRYLVRREKHNIRVFHEVLRSRKPDIVYFWNLGHTSRCLTQAAKQSGIPIGLFAFDLGLLSDENDLWTSQSRFITGSLGRFAQALILRMVGVFIGRPSGGVPIFDFVHYPTRFIEKKLQMGGMRSKSWEQIPWGVDTEVFHPAEQLPHGNILFTGQVAEHKGVHLLIEAFSCLVSRHRDIRLQLTIAGPLHDKDYKSRLDALVLEKGLSAHVTFAGRVERTGLPDLYRRHSIYVFPSLWEEPMGIGILEAMASGLAVVCSGTGGSGELFEDGQSGLKFRNGDTIDLANKIDFLLKNFEDSAKISQQAVEVCLLKHRFSNFLDTIRNLLINRYLKV